MIVDQVSEPIMNIPDEEIAQIAQPSQCKFEKRPYMASDGNPDMEMVEINARVE